MNREVETLRNSLLATLADGGFHSGEELGASLGVSRAAISKHIKALAGLGLDIFSVTGRGYKLSKPLQLLSLEKIFQHLPVEQTKAVEILNIVDSTNRYLKEKIGQVNKGHVVLAEAQTAGRGRHGRAWVSPYGASLYLSCYWPFSSGYRDISGLSLAVGIALVNALESVGIQGCRLKWPNDVYLYGKKLAGILVEVEGQLGADCDTIIGIGLNVAMPENIAGIDQPWTDLTQTADTCSDRNHLAGILIRYVRETIATFEQNGLAPFMQRWKSLDLFNDQLIKLVAGSRETTGICRGINQDGGLLVEVEGQSKAYYGGEISVRSA